LELNSETSWCVSWLVHFGQIGGLAFRFSCSLIGTLTWKRSLHA